MLLSATAIVLAIVALFPPGTIAQAGRPSWAFDMEAANYPAQVDAIVFANGTVWDGDHPTISVGRWRFTRSGPLTESLPGNQMESGVPCSAPHRSDCFYAIIMLFDCYNPATPTNTTCAMALSWSSYDGALCQVSAGPPPPPNNFPWGGILFRIACPQEVRYVK